MKNIVLSSILALGLSSNLLASNVSSKNFQHGLGLKATTLGLGLEYKYNLTNDFDIRVGYNSLSADGDEKKSDINYEYDLDLKSFSALVDYYPFNNGFSLSTGVIFNKNKVSLSAVNKGTIEINGKSYNSSDVGGLDGSVEWDKSIAPYLGMGYTSNSRNKGWSFNVELGAMYQGGAEISLSGKNINPALLETIKADIEKEKAQLEDDIHYNWYPVAGLAVSYKF